MRDARGCRPRIYTEFRFGALARPRPVMDVDRHRLTAANEAVLLNREEPAAVLEAVESRVQPQLDEFCPLE